VDGHREAELVCPHVERLAAVLLERHVPRGAGPERLVHRSRSTAAGGDGQAQVRHPEPPIAPQQEVFGFDVPVNEARVMDGLQPARGLEEHPPDLGRAPGSAVEPAAQRLALHVLESEIDLVLPGPDVVDGEHVGMGDPGERLGLGDQPVSPRLRVLPRRTEELQADPSVQGEVVGAVHHPHAAAPQTVQHHVPAEGGSTGETGHRPTHPVIRRGARRAPVCGRRSTHLCWRGLASHLLSPGGNGARNVPRAARERQTAPFTVRRPERGGWLHFVHRRSDTQGVRGR
jgi:hypothetical protein